MNTSLRRRSAASGAPEKRPAGPAPWSGPASGWSRSSWWPSATAWSPSSAGSGDRSAWRGWRARPPRSGSNGLLTAREHQVLKLVGAGATSTEVGATLGVARSTVDSHVRSAMRKLGASTRAQAALAIAGGEREPT